VYLVGHGGNRNQNFRTIRVFDPRGNYVRTVMPFPGDLPPDGMKDVAAWDDAAKTFRPRNLSSLNPEFYAEQLTLVSASVKDGLILTDGSSSTGWTRAAASRAPRSRPRRSGQGRRESATPAAVRSSWPRRPTGSRCS
jgi:hypothetical protein